MQIYEEKVKDKVKVKVFYYFCKNLSTDKLFIKNTISNH